MELRTTNLPVPRMGLHHPRDGPRTYGTAMELMFPTARPPPPIMEDEDPQPGVGYGELTHRQLLRKYIILKTIPRLALPAAIITGCIFIIGCIVGLVRLIRTLMRETVVSSDPKEWMDKIKTEYYDPCYLGCDNCKDPSYSYNACRKTASILKNNKNITCDAMKIWFWEDRYPQACLEAAGNELYQRAVHVMQKSYWKLLILILPVLGFAYILGWCVRKGWMKMTADMKANGEKMNHPGWDDPNTAPPDKEDDVEIARRNTRTYRAKKIILVFLPLFLQGARAYICAKHDPSADAYLTNQNRTIFVHVYSWYSECIEGQGCTPFLCITSPCEPNRVPTRCGFGGLEPCDKDPSMNCGPLVFSRRRPEHYLGRIMPQVTGCGFSVSETDFPAPQLRLANPGLEQNWLVRIDVNGYNVTDPRETDSEIRCLHDIGDWKPLDFDIDEWLAQ
ncbi:hypothetical protein GGS21DRAFT_80368 [Xylaria nigripes]|nr:hypothetical protein GGS21DRAFT_80368 [Xylaria nigripes]